MRGLRQQIAMFGGLAALALAVPAMAQDKEETGTVAVDDVCAVDGACRLIEEFVLEDNEGTEHRFPADIMLPWVAEGNVVLTPGDAVTVRLVESGGELLPELVSTGAASRDTALAEGELRFDFSPSQRGQAMLNVTSAYPAVLEYAALMVTVTGGPSRTSVCNLNPGLTVFESWSDPIYQLALWSFRPGQGFSCSVIDVDADD